ncbi:MAG: hypothetical protein A2Y12_16280 [Planctomycetes bacterium GWF2_42_9]|nr:MAG: hypothetical protein A2Y12_16280 [Planctomycetes bacterium GWF2_42_9]
MRGNGRLIVAVLVCLSPFVLVAVKSKESFLIFLGIMAAFIVGFIALCIAHWAVETVLVALGCDKDKINESNGNTFIFWGGDR